ncbi:hypothetical protein MRS76_11215 [Rhizobiaceae bacterium n13]|uniref:hypothetical protein n=1 Tax=Ferirhizobium litorale TaxID=2927786 RepID=UPI0024B2DF62|nr:hypothetical protein [Fererhizobium litorale]MDI7862530.1 hypothetical protein [Fererhizobium litorale]
MARLPEIQRRGAVTRAAQSSVTPAEVANPFRQIAEAFGTFGEAAQRQEIEEAGNAGQNAVFRDANGNLQVDQRSNFSQSGRAYNRAAIQGYTARLAGDIRTRGQQMVTDSKGNIDNFNASWKAFADQALTSVPKDVRGAVRTMLETEGPRFALGVSEQKRSSDLKEFEGNIKAEIQLLDDDMAALARSGGTGTDAYKQKQAQLHTLWGELSENPDFVVGKSEADIAIKRMESRHMTEGMLGTVDRALETGGIAAARKIGQSILTDKSLSLSPAERRQYAGMVNERITGYTAKVKADLKPVQDEAKKIQERLMAGVGLESPDVDTVAANLARGGDMAGALELLEKRRSAQALQAFGNADNAQQVATAETALARANGRGGGDVVDRIINVESGGNPNAKNPNSSAAGPGQFIDSTWLSMVKRHRPDLAAGRSSQEILALKSDVGLSREMTARYARENADFLRNQGLSTSAGNVYLAHFLGPRGAAQVLKADPNSSVESIVGPDVVNANGFLRGKSAADLRMWAARKMGSDDSSIDPDLIKEYRAEVTRDVKDFLPEFERGIKTGVPMSSDSLNLLTRQLSIVDDQDLRQTFADLFDQNRVIFEAGNMAPAEVESLISGLRADMAADGASVAQMNMVEGLEAAQTARTSALTSDPLGYGASKGYVPALPPVDVAQPATWDATFQTYQNAVDVMQARGEVGNISALRPETQAAIARTLETAPPSESVQLLGSMARNLNPETYKATLAKIATTADGKAAAAAGALAEVNPIAAEGVLRGRQLLKENPALAPKKTDDNTATVNDLLPVGAFAAGTEGGRQIMLDAATARYADLSHQAGDTSGELDEARMDQAISEITGGVLDMNNSKVLAPRYGMSQDDFDTLLGRLTDRDLLGATTASGTPVGAVDLRSQGRLRAVADGRYILEFGRSNAPTYAMRMPSAGSYDPRNSVFVLDLRDR